MKTVEQTAEEYLGINLFRLYKEKHPEINPSSDVVEVRRDWAMWGFEMPIYEPQSVYNMSPIGKPIKRVVVKSEQFETWAVSKDGRRFRLAFVEQFNCLYVATLE